MMNALYILQIINIKNWVDLLILLLWGSALIGLIWFVFKIRKDNED